MELVRGNRNADVRAIRIPTMNPENLGIFAYSRFPALIHNATSAKWFRSIRNLPQFLHKQPWIVSIIYYTAKVVIPRASGSRIIDGAVDCEGTLGLKPCSESILSGGAELCACQR